MYEPCSKGKYSKVTTAEMKWSTISKSVMIVIFGEFIDQLIDYPINRASLTYLYWVLLTVTSSSFSPLARGLSSSERQNTVNLITTSTFVPKDVAIIMN